MNTITENVSQKLARGYLPENSKSEGERQCLLVMGMHRSGTSALTRVISLLGARLPGNLLPEQKDNEMGFWESRDLMTLHNEILQSAGSVWDDWRRINRRWFRSLEAERYRRHLTDFLMEDFGDSPLFVIKDPRISRLLPLWIQVLEECGITPLGVIPVRNPLEVAASLKKRNGFLTAKSCLVWLRHLLEAERGSRGLRRCIVTFDDLLANWRQVTDTIADQLLVTWPRQSAAATVEIEAFLSTRHRHHSKRNEDLDAYPEVAEWVRRTYRVLLEMTHPQAAMICCERLDAIYEEFDKASGVFETVLWAEQSATREIAEAKGAAKEARLQEKIDSQAKKIDSQTQDIQHLRRDLSGSQSKAKQLEGELSSSRSQVQSLEREVSNSQTKAQQFQKELSNSQTKAQQFQEELLKSRSQVKQLEGELSSSRSQVQGLEREVSNSQTKAQQFQEELLKSRSKAKHLEIELSGNRLEVESLNGELLVTRKETDQLRNEIERIKRSKIWCAAEWLHKGFTWILFFEHGFKFAIKLIWWSVTLRLPSKLSIWRRLRSEHQLIGASGIFDNDWYLEKNPDVATTGANPLAHYLSSGAAEGRDPNPLFDGDWYLKQNPDVAATGINPLAHYLSSGATEGRDPNPLFDGDWYL
ncbi:MAG: hypothetical protein V2J55_04645, partial [Candidatus Competibacteraceae bacterium]|nr:hypothetical protein [Candidatus Competibacteraceae bacterium]